MSALEMAYDAASVVFSRSFRFVEWKLVVSAPEHGVEPKPAPFGDVRQPHRDAVTEIQRPKWIYVFRRFPDQGSPLPVQEIRIDGKPGGKGEMLSLSEDADQDVSNLRRSKVGATRLGTTLCLPRRLFGNPIFYYFYASRVRLTPEQIKMLAGPIKAFVPKVSLEPGKNTSVLEVDGELLVPVVDPTTVALHLHAAYEAAANDLIDYTVPYGDARQKQAAEQRRKKHLLATLMQPFLDDPDLALVRWLKGAPSNPVENFLKEYQREFDWRLQRRDRLATWLTRWLDSSGMKIAEQAHKAAGNWASFFTPWCRSLGRVAETNVGRDYLDRLVSDERHFVHQYLWRKDPPTDDIVGAVRKSGVGGLEAWKALVASQVKKITPEYAGQLFARSWPDVAGVVSKLDKPSIKNLPFKVLTVEDANKALVHDVQIPGKQLILFIESINLIFSLKSAAEKPDGTDRAITAFGAGLDLGQAATVLAGMEKPPQVFGLVSGVLDIYMNVKEMNKSFNEGDLDSATGSFVVASGATVGAAGTFIELFLVAGEVPLVGTVLAVAGLVLMAIGFLKKLASKSPLEKFVSHSSWGEDYGAAGNPDWSPAPYEQWKGAKEFDYQIRALLNLVCDFEIAKPDRYDKLRFKLSWHPKKISKLRVRYREKKSGGSDRVVVETEVAFTDKGPVSSNTNLRPLMVDDRTLELEVVGGVAPWRPRPRDDGQPTTPAAKRFGLTDVPDPYPDLDSAGVAAMFSITFGGQTPVHVPHAAREDGSGWKEIRLK